MRPVYESAKDRKAERFFMFLFPEYVKVPKAYGFDFLSHSAWGGGYYPKDQSTDICELKVRNYSKAQIPDGKLILSYHKVLAMRQFPADEKEIMFLLTDGLYSVSVEKFDKANDKDYADVISYQELRPALTFAGRTDRNDWQDKEPCVQYDVNKLRLIKSKEGIVEAWKRFEEKEKSA